MSYSNPMNISSKKLDIRERSRSRGCKKISCLACPFPACIKEEAGGGQWFKAMRDAGIWKMKGATGLSAGALGRHFGVSGRTVYRVLKKYQKSKIKKSKIKGGR